jgi:peptidoglycan hydrolase CwlO-like protein
MKKTIILFSLIFVFCLTFFLPINKVKNVFAECDENCLKGKIEEYNKKIVELQGQANTLSNQIAQFNAQISLAELKIQKTEDEIKLLSGRIDQVQGSVEDLTKAFTARTVATYKMARTDGPIYLLLTADNMGEAISKYHYLQEVENADQDLLARLQDAQIAYQNSKKQTEDLQKQLKDQQNVLNAQKKAKAQLLASTQNDEKKYQQLLREAQAQLAAFKRFVSGQGGASILSNQTFCNDWGCYYNQRDSQWGTKFLGNSSLTVAEYGCLVSSSAMIASFYKKNLTPADIAGNSSAFFSPSSDTALLWRDINVNGVRIIRNSIGVNTANIDAELAAGRPVIIGLYNGPAHFIVIKSGSNGNYIMNDPFMEGGHDVSFTSKYSVSNITDVESVSIQ